MQAILIPSAAADVARLAALKGTGGLLNAAKVRLFKNDVPVTEGSLLASFVAADFTGYADATITFNTPSISDEGRAEMVGTVPEFRPTDAVVQNQIYGALLLTSAGALYSACRFPGGPAPMVNTSDAIVLVIRVDPNGGGTVEVIS